jgi:hypothetical protein
LVKKKLPNTFFDSIVNLFGKKHEKESPPSRHNLRPRIEKARSEGTPATAAKTPQRKRLPPQRKKQKRLARRINSAILSTMTIKRTISVGIEMTSNASEASIIEHLNGFMEELKSGIETSRAASWNASIPVSWDESYPVEIGVSFDIK